MNRLVLCVFAMVTLHASVASVAFADDAPSDLQADIQKAHTENPASFQDVEKTRAVRNRNGTWRLVGAQNDPSLAWAHLKQATNLDLPAGKRLAHARFAGSITESADLVEKVLQDETSPEVRRAFINGLQHNPNPVTAPLVSFAEEADAKDLRAVLFVLSHRKDRAHYLKAFEKGARHTDPGVRKLSVRALGWSGSPQHSALLSRVLQDQNPEVRLSALRALERLDPSAAKLGAKRLKLDPNFKVKRAATQIALP